MRRVFCANDLNYFAQMLLNLRIFIMICAKAIGLFLTRLRGGLSRTTPPFFSVRQKDLLAKEAITMELETAKSAGTLGVTRGVVRDNPLTSITV